MRPNDTPSWRNLITALLIFGGLAAGIVLLGQATAGPTPFEKAVATAKATGTTPRIATPAPRPTDRPRTPTPTATAQPPTGFFKQGLTWEDAGTGDGTFYVYLDFVNQTGTFYDQIWIDMTCYDAADAVVGHADGVVSNVAAGERVTATLIFAGAEGCEMFRWRYDPLAF